MRKTRLREQLFQPLSLAAQGIQESIGAVKRYQPYTSCSHRKSFFFTELSLLKEKREGY